MKILLKKKKTKGEKRPNKGIKIFLKNKSRVYEKLLFSTEKSNSLVI